MRGNLRYLVLLFIVSIGLGVLFAKILPANNNVTTTKNVSVEKHDSSLEYSQSENILETAFQEEKITEDTELVLKKFYLDCNHNIERYVELPKELINLTEDELREEYEDWSIEEFSSQRVILYQKIYGICDEHFIISAGDEFVEVYSLEEDYDKELYEITNISIEYLTEEDLKKLKEGIYVYGIEELNSNLESFE